VLVLVGGAADVDVLVGVLVVGATDSEVVSLLETAVLVDVVLTELDVAGDVAPPPWLSATIPQITSASRTAASTPKPIRTAGLRCQGVGPESRSVPSL
jgi:hypothetical protein